MRHIYIGQANMIVTRSAEFELTHPIEEVFDFATSCEGFSKFLLPLGPIPGVAEARLIDASEPITGARRDVHMTDGSLIKEVLLEYHRPYRHWYRWTNRPARPFSWLVRGAEGDWQFTSTSSGTRIVWHYHFELTSPIAIVAGIPLLAFMRRWMQTGLNRLPDALRNEL
jgi:hypothetical protein